jgi:hypothetical protein
VEQIPTKLASDVIKNTSLKIIHRLVAETDRKLVGSMMNLTEEQQKYLVGLTPGEAVASAEGWSEGCCVSIPNPARHRGYEQLNPTKEEVAAHMRKLLPQVFEPYIVPAHSRPASETVPQCQGCAGDGCLFRNIILREILRCKYGDFKTALDFGWKGLWEYGESYAKAANIPGVPLPDIAYCFLMNLASVCQFDSNAIAMMKKELQIIRDWKKQP